MDFLGEPEASTLRTYIEQLQNSRPGRLMRVVMSLSLLAVNWQTSRSIGRNVPGTS